MLLILLLLILLLSCSAVAGLAAAAVLLLLLVPSFCCCSCCGSGGGCSSCGPPVPGCAGHPAARGPGPGERRSCSTARCGSPADRALVPRIVQALGPQVRVRRPGTGRGRTPAPPPRGGRAGTGPRPRPGSDRGSSGASARAVSKDGQRALVVAGAIEVATLAGGRRRRRVARAGGPDRRRGQGTAAGTGGDGDASAGAAARARPATGWPGPVPAARRSVPRTARPDGRRGRAPRAAAITSCRARRSSPPRPMRKHEARSRVRQFLQRGEVEAAHHDAALVVLEEAHPRSGSGTSPPLSSPTPTGTITIPCVAAASCRLAPAALEVLAVGHQQDGLAGAVRAPAPAARRAACSRSATRSRWRCPGWRSCPCRPSSGRAARCRGRGSAGTARRPGRRRAPARRGPARSRRGTRRVPPSRGPCGWVRRPGPAWSSRRPGR